MFSARFINRRLLAFEVITLLHARYILADGWRQIWREELLCINAFFHFNLVA